MWDVGQEGFLCIDAGFQPAPVLLFPCLLLDEDAFDQLRHQEGKGKPVVIVDQFDV